MKKFIKILSVLMILIFSASFSFAEETATYNDINFPQWTKDLRRTEIITFGSLPFVTLWTSVGYGLAVQGSFHNPLDKSTSNYSEDDQKKIMTIAVCTSLGLGLTDLAINLITRKYKKHKQSKVEQTIRVIPFSQLPQEQEEVLPENDESMPQEAEMAEVSAYMIKGLNNAIF